METGSDPRSAAAATPAGGAPPRKRDVNRDTMAEFDSRSEAVDVTRIMDQIRARIGDTRERDASEARIRESAAAKLDHMPEPPSRLDPIPAPSAAPPPAVPTFDQNTIYVSSRGLMGKLIHLIRRLLNPVLKLFFNPKPMIAALGSQAEINAWTVQLLQRQTELFEQVGKRLAAREEIDALKYKVLNDLVVEMTRLSVDMKNHRMLVESVAGRLDFAERRARPVEPAAATRSKPAPKTADDDGGDAQTGSGRPRRRRRRSRRRPSDTATATAETGADSAPSNTDDGAGQTAGTAAAPSPGSEAGDAAGDPPPEPAAAAAGSSPAGDPPAAVPAPAPERTEPSDSGATTEPDAQ